MATITNGDGGPLLALTSTVWVSMFTATRDAADDDSGLLLCVHGVFRSPEEAAECARTQVQSGAGDVFVVDRCHRWIRLRPPTAAGAAVEEEEVGSPDNEDKERGRDGSVCDLLNRQKKGTSAAAPPPPASSSSSSSSSISKKGVSGGARERLQELLDAPLSPPADAAAYAAMRERYALLRAFARKLRGLWDEGCQKAADAAAAIAAMDTAHPDYATSYRDRYRQALRESGIPEERVGFMQYLL